DTILFKCYSLLLDLNSYPTRRSSDLEYAREKQKETESPLASRLRPETLEEVAGQQHIIGKDKLLYRAIKADKLSSVIFYGPPGRSEEHTSELQSRFELVCRLLLENKT